MPYNRQIPDAPIAGSMLPRATELTLDDLLVLIQPGNPIGQKNKALTLQVLAAFLASEGHLGPLDIRKTLGQASFITKLDGDKLKIYASGPSGTTGKFFEIAYDDTNHQILSVKIGDEGSGETSSVELKNGSVTVTKVGRPAAGPLVTEITDEGSIRIRSYAQDGTTVVKQVTMNLTDGIFNGTKSNVNGLSLPNWLEVGGNLAVNKSMKFAPVLDLQSSLTGTEWSVETTLSSESAYPEGINRAAIDFDGSVIIIVNTTSSSHTVSGIGIFSDSRTGYTLGSGQAMQLIRLTKNGETGWARLG